MAMRLTLAISLVFAGLTYLFPDRIMRIYTSEAAVIAQGVRYLRITVFIFTMHGLSLVMANLMRTVGHPKLGLIVSIISFVVNIGGNYTFIFGKFGMPRMEIAGAALGTLIARAAEFLTTFIFALKIEKKLRLRFRHLLKSPSGEFYRNYFRIGAPVLVSDALLGLGGNIVSIVLGHMGAAVVAANAICQVIDRLMTVVISGISNASGIIVGHTIGEGHADLALRQGETFYLLSVIFGAVSSVFLLLLGPLTIRMYNLTPETIVITHQLMKAYAVIIFFQAIQSVMTKGVLRGGGDTRFLMMADILFMWIVSIPLGAFVGLVLQGPPWAAVLCLRIDFAIKSFWCIRRLLSGKWIHIVEGARRTS